MVVGSPRVEGDEEEEDVDDLENEFLHFQGQYIAEAMLHSQMSYGRGGVDHDHPHHSAMPQVPLLTNGPSVTHLLLLFFKTHLSIQVCKETFFYLCKEKIAVFNADIAFKALSAR